MSTPRNPHPNPDLAAAGSQQQIVGSEDASDLKSDIKDEVQSQKERASEGVNAAVDQVDKQREQAAEGAQKAADQLRERAEDIPGGEKTTELAHGAADQVERAAGYLQDHDVSKIGDDIVELVRAHPKESIIVAVAAGLLLGRTLRS